MIGFIVGVVKVVGGLTFRKTRQEEAGQTHTNLSSSSSFGERKSRRRRERTGEKGGE